jgi:hypothetical protein
VLIVLGPNLDWVTRISIMDLVLCQLRPALGPSRVNGGLPMTMVKVVSGPIRVKQGLHMAAKVNSILIRGNPGLALTIVAVDLGLIRTNLGLLPITIKVDPGPIMVNLGTIVKVDTGLIRVNTVMVAMMVDQALLHFSTTQLGKRDLAHLKTNLVLHLNFHRNLVITKSSSLWTLDLINLTQWQLDHDIIELHGKIRMDD